MRWIEGDLNGHLECMEECREQGEVCPMHNGYYLAKGEIGAFTAGLLDGA